MKALTLILILLGVPTFADPLGLVDYDLLFQENAEQVVVVDEERTRLALDGATITRHAVEGVFFKAVDTSGQGSVGCLAMVLAALDGGLKACDITLEAEQQQLRDDFVNDTLRFYSENAFPATTLEFARDRYDDLVNNAAEEARPHCSEMDEAQETINLLLAPGNRALVDELLSIPRLPVGDSCF